jgi:type IV pilus modification protein PilV
VSPGAVGPDPGAGSLRERRERHGERGASLLEALIAIVIAAAAVLGTVALQARTMSLQVDSEARRTASALLGQLRERVSGNHEGYARSLDAGYTARLAPRGAVVIPGCANPAACDAILEVPAIQIAQWLGDVSRQLPGAAAQVGPTLLGSALSMTATVGWLEPNADRADPVCDGIQAIRGDARYRCASAVFFPG